MLPAPVKIYIVITTVFRVHLFGKKDYLVINNGYLGQEQRRPKMFPSVGGLTGYKVSSFTSKPDIKVNIRPVPETFGDYISKFSQISK